MNEKIQDCIKEYNIRRNLDFALFQEDLSKKEKILFLSLIKKRNEL